MKNKFIILTLCFTIIFSNINLNNYKSYANNYEPLVSNVGSVTSPMVGTIATLAVASGIALNTYDDLYDIVAMFNSVNSNYDVVKEIFDRDVKILGNKLVSVGNDFLNLCKNAFDVYFSDVEPSKLGSVLGIENILNYKILDISTGTTGSIESGRLRVDYKFNSALTTLYFDVYVGGVRQTSSSTGIAFFTSKIKTYQGQNIYFKIFGSKLCAFLEGYNTSKTVLSLDICYDYTIDYAGGYDFDNINSRLEEDNSICVGVPGNLGSLVGGNVDVFSPSYPLTNGGVSLPFVDSPTVDVTDDVFVGSPSTDVPGVGDPSVPSDGIWSTIKDFVISLVVPSDTFWTDTFNSFRDNFSKNFPMLDMSKFDSLAVGGKPFPNLYAYGSKIVDGDVINSIVDWLRPIIAGFIMICLMFFNYRKIYKLIRNTEPFGGIAQGSSDFRTGLSAPPINNGLDPNPMGNLRDMLFDMRNEILRRENEK